MLGKDNCSFADFCAMNSESELGVVIYPQSKGNALLAPIVTTGLGLDLPGKSVEKHILIELKNLTKNVFKYFPRMFFSIPPCCSIILVYELIS